MIIYPYYLNYFHFFFKLQLAGILEPNDGLCHLDGTGKYTKAEVQVVHVYVVFRFSDFFI